MAFLDQTPAFTPQLSNIAGALQGPSITGLLGAQPGQFNLATILQQLGQPTATAGVGTGQSIADILGALGQPTAAAGAGGLAGAAGALTGFGGGVGAAEQSLQDIIAREQAGTLSPGGEAAYEAQVQQTKAAIKGKYAQLGQSGSTAEQSELDQADLQGLATKFGISAQLGQLAGGQTLQNIQQMLGGLTGGGQLASTLGALGVGALGTAGQLGTTLAQLGLGGLRSSAEVFTNIANSAIQSLGLQSDIFKNLANIQAGSDQQLTSGIGDFFKALAGTSGLFGTQGLLSGTQGLLAGLGGGASGVTGLPAVGATGVVAL